MASIVYPHQVASIVPFQFPHEKKKTANTKNISEEKLEQFLTEYKSDLNKELTKEQKYELLRILYEYRDIFARSFKDIKIINVKNLAV